MTDDTRILVRRETAVRSLVRTESPVRTLVRSDGPAGPPGPQGPAGSGGGGGGSTIGDITGLQAALDAKADLTHVNTVEDDAVLAESQLDARLDAVEPLTPSSGQKDALVGTSGTPSSTNKYVTNADSRLSDTRTPTDTSVSTAKLANDAVTNTKLANMAVDTVKGRATAGTGDPEDIAFTAAGRALVDDVDAAAQRTTLGLGTMATVSATAGGDLSGTYPNPTVANDAVTNAKLANMAVDTVKGRATAGTGDPEDIALTAAGRALIDDANASAQRTTLGLGSIATENVAASGDLAGNWPSPTVAAIHETSGPTKLTFGAIADGDFLKRNGSTVVGGTPAAASSDLEVFAFAFGFGE